MGDLIHTWTVRTLISGILDFEAPFPTPFAKRKDLIGVSMNCSFERQSMFKLCSNYCTCKSQMLQVKGMTNV